jgi:oxygen-independent coproporphyrinogen-3 oxidase
MAGFYVHIPFCRRQCYYCDFHFSVSFKQKNNVIFAIQKEILDRKYDFSKVNFHTIYFGGGTPSILSTDELNNIINLIKTNYNVAVDAEITLEANPDDLSQNYLYSLRNESFINRLSVGIQSFNDRTLKFLNRQHNSELAYQSIKQAKTEGFDNINIDLIYGIPGAEEKEWQQNLEIFRSLNLPHLSAYHLTIEPKTVFAHHLKKGKIEAIDEEKSVMQFGILMKFANENGYDHYEISNFAKPGFQSRHNLGYWSNLPYMGIGPSAHSFHQHQRRWNVANNTKYCQLVLNNSDEYFEQEKINIKTAYNEYLMTSLRTSKGINSADLKKYFGEEFLSDFRSASQKFLKRGSIIKMEENYSLTDEGKLIADYIISEFMKV